MMHPHQSRTRNRDRRLAQQPARDGSGPVAWIVASCFIFILAYAFVAPVFQHILGTGQ